MPTGVYYRSPKQIERQRQLCKKVLGNYKHSPETYKIIGEKQKGKYVSEETKAKIKAKRALQIIKPESIELTRQSNLGRKHSEEWVKKVQLKNLGKKRSQKIRDSRKGSGNPAWRGGITPLLTQIHNCNEMKEWKRAIIRRDNARDWFSGCNCSKKLEVHHIIRIKNLIEKYNITTIQEAISCKELWDTNNGITMFKTSHQAYHQMWS
jgi:hypothetical protein